MDNLSLVYILDDIQYMDHRSNRVYKRTSQHRHALRKGHSLRTELGDMDDLVRLFFHKNRVKIIKRNTIQLKGSK